MSRAKRVVHARVTTCRFVSGAIAAGVVLHCAAASATVMAEEDDVDEDEDSIAG